MSTKVPDSRPAFSGTTIKEILEANEHILELRKKVRVAPKDPGVYRWKNTNGEVLYVGKAKNLRNRLQSYVSPAEDANVGPWKRSMLRSIADLELTITRSELEALVLETNLIKEIKPKYNVLMKDDKNYVYVRISKEVFPEVSVVRQMYKDKAAYFGPFVSSYETKRMLEVTHLVFPFMAAKETITTLNKKAKKGEDTTEPIFATKPLSVQIGKHCSLGTGEYSHEQYLTAIDQLKQFLRGDRKQVMSALEVQMTDAALTRKFEKAAKLRDSLTYMKSLEEKQIVSDTTGNNADYIGLAVLHGYSQAVLMKERDGKLIAEQSFSFKGQSEDELEVLQSFIAQFYSSNGDIPAIIVLPFSLAEQEVLRQWLESLRGKSVELRVPERGKKVELLELATKNAEQKVKQQEARWEAEKTATEAALKELQVLLTLPAIPERIEGYDISHLAGTHTVGSMVVTKHGKAANDHYRSFTIKSLTAGAIDDYASLKEVLRRRLAYLVDSLALQLDALQAKGITIRRAKKTDIQQIFAAWQSSKTYDTIKEFTADIDYKTVFIACKKEEIIAILRVYQHDGLTEITNVQSIGNVPEHVLTVLIRSAVKTVKKGKIYTIIASKNEQLWTALGATAIRTVPKTLTQSTDVDSVCMMLQVAKQKKDVSLSARPDLLVIDGGKGQLSTIVAVLQEYQLDIPVIGLAKREEEVFIPNQSYSIEMKKGSQAQFLLMRLRNEAHRFANQHREKRGIKQYKTSVLDEIEGIGPATKDKLLQRFGSIEAITNASDTDLLLYVTQSQLAALKKHLL